MISRRAVLGLRFATMTAAQAAVLLLVAVASDVPALPDLGDAVIAVVVISFATGLTWPWTYRLASQFRPLRFPVNMLATGPPTRHVP